MKRIALVLIMALAMVSGGFFLIENLNNTTMAKPEEKVLVAYFSHTGNTETIAKTIAKKNKRRFV